MDTNQLQDCLSLSSNKKISKQSAISFNISAFITAIKLATNYKITLLSRVLVGLSRLYTLKCSIVLAEFSSLFVNKSVTPPRRRRRSDRQLPLRPIKVEVETKNEDGTEIQEPENITENIEQEELLDRSFDAFSVEDVRDFTNLAELTQIEVQREKRRKVEEDEEIEYDKKTFQTKIRNLKMILKREELRRGSLLAIQPEINEFFNKSKFIENRSVEIARQESFSQINFDNEIGDSFDNVSVDSRRNILHDLEGEFSFNEVVQGLSKSDQADAFYEMLCCAGEGRFAVTQNAPFGRIVCVVN